MLTARAASRIVRPRSSSIQRLPSPAFTMRLLPIPSVAARLLVLAIPAAGNPVSQTNASGTTAQLSVTATGTSLTYQWYDGATTIMGATSFLYMTPTLTPSHTYHVVVTNGCGTAMSANASITVNCPVSITGQPQDIVISSGQTASLTVGVSVPMGATAPYQWYQ